MNDIVAYYDECEVDYRIRWHLDRCKAMHFGYWDRFTRTLPQALVRENQVLAELATVGANDRVLDAGCGVGGSALFLARTRGCRVHGITLSGKQVERAREYAARASLDHRATFSVADFCATGLPAGSFDVVWAIESVCHADDKAAFLREAFRLLCPGGRLVLADFVATRDVRDPLVQRWLAGWAVPRLATRSQLTNGARAAGFRDVRYREETEHVRPSARRLFATSLFTVPLSTIGERLRIRTRRQTSNQLAVYYQFRALQAGLWEYGLLLATK